MRRLTIAVFVLTTLALPAWAADDISPARALIERSIAYHDPGGIWWSSVRTVALRQDRAEGAEQKTTFRLFPGATGFNLRIEERGLAMSGSLRGDSCSIAFAGDDTAASRSRFEKLDCERMRLYRAYYGYLFNAPMNLLDAAGTIEPEVIETSFENRAVHAVRISYGPDQPRWEHYFDPGTAALVGCRFARDPAWKTGEYIVYSGETQAGAVWLPRKRAWYYNENGRWLGTDVIEYAHLMRPRTTDFAPPRHR